MQQKAKYGLAAAAVVVVAGAGAGLTVAAAPPGSADTPASAQSITVPATYESMDTNGDMMVSKKEALAAMPNLNFEAADTNHDGELSRTEYQDLKEKVANGTWTNQVPKQEVVKQIAGYDDNPVDVVEHAAKGTLKNPYDETNATVASEGHQLFLNHGCSSCRGGGGGGGMGPPLNNGVWIYGESDDTLFRLVSLGSAKLQAAGYSRVNTETPALMPQQGGSNVTKAGDLWKIITWVKSMNAKH